VKHDQGIEDTLENHSGILLRVDASLLDLVEELLAIQVLQDQVDIVVRLEDFIQLENVRVSDLPEKVDFVMDA